MTDSKMRAEFEAWALLGRPASAWDNWQLCWQAARQSALEEAAKVCSDVAARWDADLGERYGEAAADCAEAIRQLAAQADKRPEGEKT